MSSFFTRLNSVASMTVWLLNAPQAAQTKTDPLVAFAFPSFSLDTARKGTIVYLVKEADLGGVISGYLGAQPNYLYLYSPQYNLVCSIEEILQTDAERNRVLHSAAASVSDIPLSGARFQMQRYMTDLYGFQIITCVKLDKLYGDVEQLRVETILLGLAVTLLILVGAVLLARYSYRPIRKLLNTIGPDDREEEMEEFARIDQHIANARSEVFQLHEKLAMQRPMVRDRFLISLLRGTMDEAAAEQMQSACPDLVPGERYACVMLALGQGKSLMYSQHLLERPTLPGATVHGVYLEDERIFALLMLLTDNEDRRTGQAQELLNLLHGQSIQGTRVSVGEIVRDADQIPTSFLQAYIAMNSSTSREITVYTPEAPEAMAGVSTVKGNAVDLYLQSLRSVDSCTALRLLDDVLAAMKTSPASLLNASYLRFDLFSRALTLCEPEAAAPLRLEAADIRLFSDEERFKDLMTHLTETNCREVDAKRNAAQRESRRLILASLREHCFEPDFSLSRLAVITDYSATYINRCLREETGYSFLQLVSMNRIARARQDLVETDDRIKDIVTRVGYLDMASFARKFKEMEGVTPGEYREIHRQGK
jgi:AraC-like DNA-binding protein